MPHPIAPTPPMIRIGLAALEPLDATTTPTTVARAPMLVTAEPRKLFDLKTRASARAGGDAATTCSTSKPLNHPAVPTIGPSAPRMILALPQYDSNRSAWS